MQKGSRPDAGSARKYPRSSHVRYHRPSIPDGSYVFGNSPRAIRERVYLRADGELTSAAGAALGGATVVATPVAGSTIRWGPVGGLPVPAVLLPHPSVGGPSVDRGQCFDDGVKLRPGLGQRGLQIPQIVSFERERGHV